MKTLLTILLCAVALSASSQSKTGEIRGIIKDSSGRVLTDATLSLLRLPDSTVARRLRSGNKGFAFRDVAFGEYVLSVTYIGFKKINTPVGLSEKARIIEIAPIILKEQANSLVEVIVKAEIPPVIVRKDTIIYNAGAFKTRPFASVEELLKKLPGIEISPEGAITLNGQRVEQIYVDGKELSLLDPKTITKNFTAEMVEKIEAFNDRSRQEKLSGIKTGEHVKGLNLKLKKNMNSGIFGKVYSAHNGDGDYSSGTELNYFKGEQYGIAKLNSNNSNNLYLGREHKGKIQPVSGKRTSATYGIDYRNRISKRLTGAVNYSGSNNKNTGHSSQHRQSFLKDSVMVEDAGSIFNSTNGDHRLGTRLEYKPDSLSTLMINPSAALTNNANHSSDTRTILVDKSDGKYRSNEATTQKDLSGKSQSISNILSYTRRSKKPGTFITATLLASASRQKDNGNFLSLVNNYDQHDQLTSVRKIDQQSTQNSSGYNINGRVALTQTLKKGQMLDLSYNLLSNFTQSDQRTFNRDSITGAYDLPDSLTTNAFENNRTTHRWEAGYFKGTAKFDYRFGMGMEFSLMRSRNQHFADRNVDQKLINWFPRASLKYKITDFTHLNFGYDGNSTQPGLEQLQPLPDFTNPFLIRLANPALARQFDHRFMLSYYSFNVKKLKNFNASVSADVRTDKITPSTTIVGQGVQHVQYVNVNGSYSIRPNISYDFPLIKQKYGRGRISTQVTFDNDISLVNGAKNHRKGLTAYQTVGIHFNSGEHFFIDLNASLSYTKSQYSLSRGMNADWLSQEYFIDLSWMPIKNLNISSNFLLNVTGAQNGEPGRTIPVWHASINWYVFKNKQGQVQLMAFDLLNRNSDFRRQVGENFILATEQQVMKRFFLFGFVYNLRAWGF